MAAALARKPGTTASIVTCALLSRLRDSLAGQLTLSDEERPSARGARCLMEHHSEVHGDCLLNGERGGPESIRFGERGPLWIEFTLRVAGAHGAYVHETESGTKLAMRLAADVESLTKIEAPLSDNIRRAVHLSRPVMDRMMGQGAGDLVNRVTLNIGTIRGGEKVNMTPTPSRLRCGLPPAGRDDQGGSPAADRRHWRALSVRVMAGCRRGRTVLDLLADYPS